LKARSPLFGNDRKNGWRKQDKSIKRQKKKWREKKKRGTSLNCNLKN